MNDTTCITYNNPTHERFQEYFEKQYAQYFTYYQAYKKKWLEKTDFYKTNMQVFSYEKYAGYFLWKPFCIKSALDTFYTTNVLYCDCNVRFKDFRGFEKIFNEIIGDTGFFFIRHKNFFNAEWTKRDAFILMDADEYRYWRAPQIWTSVIGFTKSQKSRQFLEEYLFFCRNPQIVTETPNLLGENLEGFREHRWEQSVVSILAEKYQIAGVYDDYMTQFVEKIYDADLYAYKEQINKDPLKKVTDGWNI